MYEPSDIDKLVTERLEAHFHVSKVLCNIGWVSLENPGIRYRPQYLNSFNFATEVDEIDYIRQFTRDANVDTVRWFYRQTNGMSVLGGGLFVPGVLFHRDDFEGHDFSCVPMDFSAFGGFALPEHTPVAGFQIGGGHRKAGDRWTTVYDIVTKSGEIVGGFFDGSSEVTDRFESIPKWLTTRIDQAADALKQEILELTRGSQF